MPDIAKLGAELSVWPFIGPAMLLLCGWRYLQIEYQYK